jgi:hypothetical protein
MAAAFVQVALSWERLNREALTKRISSRRGRAETRCAFACLRVPASYGVEAGQAPTGRRAPRQIGAAPRLAPASGRPTLRAVTFGPSRARLAGATVMARRTSNGATRRETESNVSRRRGDQESTLHLAVSDGFVSCPRRGLTDIVECFACSAGRGLSAESDEHFLCAWDPRSATDGAAGHPLSGGTRRGA